MKENKAEKMNINVGICKLVAACFVIFLHVIFTGNLGKTVECFGRISVPFFFAISGYYSYHIDTDRIKKRFISILKLLIISNAIYLIWDLFYKCYIGGTAPSEYLKATFSVKKLATFFLMDGAITSFHLWYLTAMMYVYIIFLIYTAFWKERKIDYRYLYFYALIGFVILILFALKVQAVNIGEYHWVYRNSLFLGLPFFSLGLFIHEYRKRIMENYFFQNKIITYLLFVASIGLGLIQYYGVGKTDFPIMLTYAVFVLVLYSTGSKNSEKVKNPNAVCKLLGRMSMIIYVIHVLIRDIFRADHEHKKIFGELSQNGYVFPLVVLAVTILISFLVSVFMGYVDSVSDKQ